jgi:ABC-2 type transport system ATP-binding protein
LEYTIETHDLTKKFALQKGFTDFLRHPFRKDEMPAVFEVNLNVKSGELFGILGPNGAGKTTLIKMLCTLILPSEGTARVNGYDITKDSGKVRRSIGFVTSDERSFYWRLTGRHNLRFFSALHNYYSDDAEERIDALLSLVGMAERGDDKFLSYSAGMKQRMAIARGLLNDPAVLFMDEPTRALDPGAAQHLRGFIRDRIVGDAGKTVFLSTHHLPEAEELCDRIAIINEGRIVAVGTLDELKSTLDKPDPGLGDVFTHYTGKEFERGAATNQIYQGRRRMMGGGRHGGMRF